MMYLLILPLMSLRVSSNLSTAWPVRMIGWEGTVIVTLGSAS